jgi:IclR family transcriptional regulator, acetate operon repressor
MAKIQDDDLQPRHPIGSVENALRLLVMLRDRESIRVSDAAAELGVARSTAHRLIAMLVSYRAVVQDQATRAYTAGPLLAELGAAANSHEDLVGALHPFLDELSTRIDETVHLMVLEGTNCRFADSVESRLALRVTGRVGVVYPAHTTSGGKALLAEFTDDEIRELYPGRNLPGTQTERSLTTRKALLEELAEIRRRGYATNFGESTVGIAAMAMTQRTRSGRIAGAIAISAPDQRMAPKRVPVLLKELTEISREVTRRIA